MCLLFNVDDNFGSYQLGIVNGRLTKPEERDEYKYMVGIFENDIFVCSGVILSDQIILSAAHCFNETVSKTYHVLAGTKELEKRTNAQYIKAKNIVIYKDYKNSKLNNFFF